MGGGGTILKRETRMGPGPPVVAQGATKISAAHSMCAILSGARRGHSCVWGGRGVAPYYRGRPVWVGRWVREEGPVLQRMTLVVPALAPSVYATLT